MTRISPLAYVKNLKKEGTDLVNAWQEAYDASAGTSQSKAAQANKKQQAETGQFLGALLKGRRYDQNGKQVKK